MTQGPTSRECANALRVLAIDAVQQANSGHPGMPMGMADIAEVLWRRVLRHNPNNPQWLNRDRLVLSNGHGVMLLYGVLHLCGYDVTIEDIKQFRQLHARTPGHPEWGETPGVEATTGPLGQGLAMAVGMALAERRCAAQFNRPGLPIIDHRTFVLLGDGCLMEGISHEAASLAGVHKLSKLVALVDDNGISIDGQVEAWFSDDTAARFRAYGWQVIESVDGHDAASIESALQQAGQLGLPTLILCRTQIGFGAPNKAGTAAVHGAPLGHEEIAATRAALNWPHTAFDIPTAIYHAWDMRAQGQACEDLWQQLWQQYQSEHPGCAAMLQRQCSGQLPSDWTDHCDRLLAETAAADRPRATRQSSQAVLSALAGQLPELVGGSADLTGSNGTWHEHAMVCSAEQPVGNYLHYGVREFAMAAVMNGLALHAGVLPYAGTFLVFSDYARNAIRLSALMQQRVIYVMTHDSIGLGEDGPTHQPIEQLSSLRLIPQLSVWRPCDDFETAVAWQQAIAHQGPSVLALSRQAVPQQAHVPSQAQDVARGAYVLSDPCVDDQTIDGVFIATGTEVAIAVEAAARCAQQGCYIRVVSMPCVERFSQQTEAYQQSVLPDSLKARVVIEAGVTDLWWRWVGSSGRVMGIDRFGYSAPADAVYQACGITVEQAVEIMVDCVKAHRSESLEQPL